MKVRAFIFLLFFVLVIVACNRKPVTQETYTTGRIKVAVDENFAPIIDDQLMVFNSTYPDAHIDTIYKPEILALNLLLSDSVKVAVLARKLTAKEAKNFELKNLIVRTNRIAVDGIALIASTASADTAVLLQDVLKVVKGQTGPIKSLVFDNPNSSTVRYLKQLAAVTTLPSVGIYALKSNEEVIRYVVEHPGSIGVVGLNWIEQPDSDSEPYVKQTKFLGVKNLPGKPGSDAYYRPNQTSLALGTYALSRDVYIIDCSGGGLGTGFASFLAGERGQRIILKSGLLPDSIPSREIIIKK